MQTLSIGEILWDIFPDKKVWGGAPANFIFHTAQMGAQASAYSAVGNDELGKEISESIEVCGINLWAPIVDYPTGLVNITLNEDGSANYQFNLDCAWDHIPLSAELINLSTHADLIAFGSLSQRSEESRKTIYEALGHRKPSCKVLFDINLRQSFYNSELIKRSLNECDFLKLNEEELAIVCDVLKVDKDELLEVFNLELIILTLGAEGSSIISQNSLSTLPASPCKIVDTVGAGDSFTASFIVNYLQGMSIKNAQKLASDVAAYVCSHSGATVDLPLEFKEHRSN
jgi:fructokinase